jgi:hypothetical protein
MLDLATLAGKIEATDRALQQEAAAAARVVEEREGSLLRFCRRLLAIVRVVLDDEDASIPGAGWQGIVMSILTKEIATVRAAHALAVAGYAREVSIVVRSALEALITALFIAKEDSALRARRWIQFSDVQRAGLLKRNRDPALSGPEFRAERRRSLARARRLKKHFPRRIFWASGLKKQSLRDLAEDVEMLWHYRVVYWSLSQGTHASAIGVGAYVGDSSTGSPVYNLGLGLPVEGLRGELAVCCELLVRTLYLLSPLCKLDLVKLCSDLILEYKTAFDGDAVAGAVPAPPS